MESKVLPRRFHLLRHKDVSGISGTGVVAEGAVWSSGAVALHWPGHPQATSIWASVRDVLEVHGHDGATELVWLDPGPAGEVRIMDRPDQPARDAKGWPILNRQECVGAGE